ncbi:MAG: hypothetical protein J6S20_02390 [Paludibacteraceae bacterium]|nr:hypothetical protein [Paludibacteraceae bacterium]
MEDFFITLIVVISVVVSIVNKIREGKRQHTSAQDANPAPSVNWEEVIRHLPHQEVETVEKESSIDNTEVEQEPQPTFHDLVDKELKKQTATEAMPEPNENDALEFSTADDLKKAVIYSEVLNRKY